MSATNSGAAGGRAGEAGEAGEVGGAGGAGALAAFSETLAETVARAGQSVVRVDARRRRSASGVIWTAGGLVVTADHAVERDEDLAVGLPDGSTASATVAGRDPGSDLALLRVAAEGLLPIERGPAPRVGHLALVVARGGRGPATSMGLVSAVGAPGRTWRGGRLDGIIWTDAALYPGFSGAPLVDTAGRMLGLVTAQFGAGAGVAISLATVERVASSLASHGRVRRGYLGVGSQAVALPEPLRRRLGLSQETGLLVVAVEPGTPADRGGLLIGDVIVALGGQPVCDTDDLLAQLGPERVGQPAVVRVIRGGEGHEVTLTVGERG